jgi:anti-anti-sigma regulatory factor
MSNRHHSDQELIGQGLANVIAPFFGGIPVTGVLARTAVNIRSGAKTRLSGIVHALVLLLLSILLSKYAEQIPLAALGGILILTGFRLVEWEAFRQIWRASKYEGYVVILTTAASVLIDLTAGVMIGLMLACGLFIRQMSAVKIIQQDSNGYGAGHNSELKQTIPSCKFVGTFLVDGPLFFGAAERFTETILLTQHLKVVVLHMKAVSHMDLTGAETLLSIHAQLKRNGVRLVLAELPFQAFSLLKRLNALEKIGIENFYQSYREALLSVNQSLLETTCMSCASCLEPRVEGSPQGPKDCNLRNALVLNTNQMNNLMRARIKGTDLIMPVTATAAGSDENSYRLIPIQDERDIPACLLGTPIAELFRAQNLYEVNEPDSDKADLIVGMCMDYRKHLHLPRNCAYIIRRAGANMKDSEFSIALGVSAGIKYMALIVHNKCIMSNPFDRREQFIHTLVAEQGWPSDKAEAFFEEGASSGEINDAIEFGMQESERLMDFFPNLNVVPLLYNVDDDKIYLLKDWLIDKEVHEPELSNP